jgi:hypothetical protein
VEEGRAAVVGGAVRAQFDHTKIKDIDVFVFSRENYDHLVCELGAEPLEDVQGVYTLPGEVPIEIVFEADCGNTEQCVAHADFDIAGGVYSAGRFYLPDGYAEAIKGKVMHFLRAVNPRHSYFRYIKYNREYGYRIDSSIRELLRVWRESA